MEKRIFNTFIGVTPPNYVKVSRWIGASEVELWKQTHTHIPNEVGRGSQIYVTLEHSPG